MKKLFLLDLPTFPKGTLGLSLAYLASFFKDQYEVTITDLNYRDTASFYDVCLREQPILIGLKVSSQNFDLACEISAALKKIVPDIPILWGGEFPSLLPDKCFPHADHIVKGLFDSVAARFISDLKNGTLQPIYTGENTSISKTLTSPDWSIVPHLDEYNLFMGLPLETSRGCTEVCTFCMVHTMQNKHYHLKPIDIIQSEVTAIGARFINIIDYNFGVSKQHVLDVCKIIKASDALGFMAETCIENLDDDEILQALGQARCKMIYCGLETIEDEALKSVHKMNTNIIANYKRIIEKARKHGVLIASGFILGMKDTKPQTFSNTLNFFREVGIMYVKLTFLTYNPGTASYKYYKKKGVYPTEEAYGVFDGNHLSYIPEGVNDKDIYNGATWFINNFYSVGSIVKRAGILKQGWLDSAAFILFNICYAIPYRQWVENDIFSNEGNFNKLLKQRYRKTFAQSVSEKLLVKIWKIKKAKSAL